MKNVFRIKNIIGLALLFALSFFLYIYIQKPNNKPLESTKSKSNKIVIIGHLYPLFKKQYMTILKNQIKDIKGLKGVIFAGDIVPISEEKHYDLLQNEFVNKIKAPFYYIPANHEMSDEKMFQHKASQFATLNNQNIFVGNTKFILYSVHKQNLKPARSNVECGDTLELKNLILENRESVDQTYLVLADLKCFRRPKWKQIIHPLIKKHINTVIIGDNASTKYNYTWEKYDGVNYIFQGITHRGHRLSGDNTFLSIENKNIKLHHLRIEDALDPSYKTRKKFKKLTDN